MLISWNSTYEECKQPFAVTTQRQRVPICFFFDKEGVLTIGNCSASIATVIAIQLTMIAAKEKHPH